MILIERMKWFERYLLDAGDDELARDIGTWVNSEWPAKNAHVGMRVERLTHKHESGVQFMLHRFWPDEGAHRRNIHAHPYALAAHVLGPGSYEVGFLVNGAVQSRAVFEGSFYYEMHTPEVQHYVLPVRGPVYSVAIWAPFQPKDQTPPPINTSSLGDPHHLLKAVEGVFTRVLGRGPGRGKSSRTGA